MFKDGNDLHLGHSLPNHAAMSPLVTFCWKFISF